MKSEAFVYLDDLFTKYNFENIIRREGPRRIYYYMPYELVINEYLTNYVDVHKTRSDLMNPWENWISKFVITRVCEWSLRLTIQEYFDLLVLHINRKSDRAMLLCENEIIDVEDLQLSQSALTEEALDFDEQERKINRERILWALKQCNGIKRDAAKMLEMSHTTFYTRMKEYGIPTNKL